VVIDVMIDEIFSVFYDFLERNGISRRISSHCVQKFFSTFYNKISLPLQPFIVHLYPTVICNIRQTSNHSKALALCPRAQQANMPNRLKISYFHRHTE